MEATLIDSRKPFQSTSMIRQPVSESGRLYHGDGGTSGCPPPEGVDVAYPLVLVATGVKMLARRHHAPTIKRIVPTSNESAVHYGADLIQGAFELHVYRRGS
jgi:hypothetical protein